MGGGGGGLGDHEGLIDEGGIAGAVLGSARVECFFLTECRLPSWRRELVQRRYDSLSLVIVSGSTTLKANILENYQIVPFQFATGMFHSSPNA